MKGLSKKKRVVLATLATAKGASFSPVQIQKLLFLLDQRAAEELEGPHFSFIPYHYGPFDAGVYRELESLAEEGLVEIFNVGQRSQYRATVSGLAEGVRFLEELPGTVTSYIQRLSDFVRSLSFTQLVSLIYAEYPNMRVNSVFQP